MKKLFGLMLAIGLQVAAYAQQNVSGTVKNTSTQQPLADASVHLSTSKNVVRTALTNERGEFAFKNLGKGQYTLTVSFIGFKTISKNVIVGDISISDMLLMVEPATVVSGEALVQATRAKDNSASTFTNINKQELAKQNFGQDLPFLLNLTPSTVINSDAGAGIGYTGIRIRGVDPTRTNVTINGIPVNDAESHGTFWVNTPDLASSVENIQVQRGVGTSTNGAAAFGASINIQTDGLSHKPFAEIANSIGSFNTRKHTVKFGTGLLENGWAFDLRLSKLNSDGFIDRSSSDLKSFFTSASRYGKKSLLYAGKYQLGVQVTGTSNTVGTFWGPDITNTYTGYTINDIDYYDYPDGTTIFVVQSSGFTPDWLVCSALTKNEALMKSVDDVQIFSNNGIFLYIF
jgi:iron complex outermembrane receptor protein